MTLFGVLTRSLTLPLLALLLSGCGPLAISPEDEKRDPHVLSAQNRYRAMDYDGAIAAYEAALAANPRNALAHKELGFLYEEKKNNYATAIHHFQRHLELRPESTMAEVIKQRIFACTFELAKTVPLAVLNRQVQEEIRRAQSTNAMLLAQIQMLKSQMVEQASMYSNQLAQQSERLRVVQSSPVQMPPAADRRSVIAERTPERRPIEAQRVQPQVRYSSPVRANPIASGSFSRSHVVRPGETMASIARTYGVSLTSLRVANPTIEPRRLRAGQVVNVPRY